MTTDMSPDQPEEKKIPDRIVRVKNITEDPTKLERRAHPLDVVEWVDPALLSANGYNPNRVFTPEMQLLKQSIMEEGWTQPIVVRPDNVIVDGFHRWTLGSHDPEIRAISGGLVPVVRVSEAKTSADHMIATIRHNRARGVHGILAMSDIVQQLKADGLSDAEISSRLGMEQEEIDRLAEVKGSPDLAGRDSFGKGWAPKPSEYAFQKVKPEKKSGIKKTKKTA